MDWVLDQKGPGSLNPVANGEPSREWQTRKLYPKLQEGVDLSSARLHARFYQPAERIQNFKDLVQRLLDEKVQRMGSGTLSKAFTNQIQDLTQEAQGVAAAENIWDNFKILVFTYRRFWWTQQWFTGYMAWAAYMAIECRCRCRGLISIVDFVQATIDRFAHLLCCRSHSWDMSLDCLECSVYSSFCFC